MAQHETYGNWLGPPPAPPKRLVRAAGIYCGAGKMMPAGDFRPGSPDSFEDDYDDVSLSELDRGHKPPVANEDLQSQRSKGGTRVYILAGKPASPHPSQKGEEPKGGKAQSSRDTSIAILYVLVVLSFVAWGLLFALAVVKQMEITAELKLLKANYSENEANVWQELSEMQREQTRMRSRMHNYYEELQDIAALICRSVQDNRKCWAGWRIFEQSCYSFSTKPMSWWDANKTCAEQGAHLVFINSEMEQNFLKDNINTSTTYWLGVTDQQEEGTWLWTNGERPSISYWNTWKESKDKDQKDCGTIGPDGIWNAERCSHSSRWICEKSWNC
ncbi:C-type lectin domain family 17, member A-like isoform X1 [Pezoporus occidentalis]|uniref:C-type lectin domain family 17, member A-like isoform X1 n=1 Tax=Pezoporus occidentalis TaxID=407982 RepID=UPI002F914050